MKRLFLIVFGLFWAASCFAQRAEIDSLLAILDEERPDTARVYLLKNLSAKYTRINPDSGVLYGERALRLAQETGFQKGEAGAYNSLGANYWTKGDYPRALECHRKVLQIQEGLSDQKEVAGSYNLMGRICRAQGDYSRALEFYRKALQAFESCGDRRGVAMSYSNIGIIYGMKGDYHPALEFFYKALEIQEALGDRRGIANSYVNISNVYSFQGDDPRALEFLQKVLEIFEPLGDRRGMALSYDNIGSIYYNQGDYSRALEYYLKALRIHDALGDRRGEASSYINIGVAFTAQAEFDSADFYQRRALALAREIDARPEECHALNCLAGNERKRGRPAKALLYARQGLDIAQEIGEKELVKGYAATIYAAAKELGQYKEALEAHETYKAVADSLFNEEQTREIARLEAEYEYAQEKKALEKEREQERALGAARLRGQRRLTLAVTAGLLAAAALALLAFRQSALRKAANRHLALQKRRVSDRNEELQMTLDRLREAQAQLVESEKMASLGQLTAGVAHEINNPINFVSANVSPLRADVEDLRALLGRYRALHEEGCNREETLKGIAAFEQEVEPELLFEEVETLLEGIAIGAGRTKEIVNGLRAFSRYEDSERKRVNLHDCAEATLVILRHQIGRQRVEVDKDFGNLPHIDAFPGKLNQVFMNLLSNALQALKGREGGRVEICTRQLDEATVRVRVLDNGPGFPPEDAGRLFEPFYTTKPVGEGTGLGLSIVYGIVQQHGGRIEALNRPEGGAEFVLDLPVRYEEEEASTLKTGMVS